MKFFLIYLLVVLVTAGCSDTPVNNGTIATVIPGTPGNLRGNAVSATQANLVWTDLSNNEQGFKIERKLVGGVYTLIGNVSNNDSTFEDNGLNSNTIYTYRVFSYNTIGNSVAYTNEVTVNTGLVLPATPTFLTGIATGLNTVALSWVDNSSNESGFKIERRISGGVFTLIDSVNSNSINYSNGGLILNTSYTYRVYAFNIFGKSPGYTNEVTLNTATVLPNPPGSLTGMVASTSQLNLSWIDNSDNEQGFRIERKLDGGNFALAGTVNAGIINYNDVGLLANTNYTYRVFAYNAFGNSLNATNELLLNTGGGPAPISTVTICSQIWMTKNLEVSRYRNGDIIPEVTDGTQWINQTTGAWCWYNNDSANYSVYGKLYNWYAVNDPRGLAPIGYHIPSEAEFNVLVLCVDPAANIFVTGYQSLTGVGSLKESGTAHWLTPNLGATNVSGFTALPAGVREATAAFQNLNAYCFLWTSTEDPLSGWYRRLYFNDAGVYRQTAFKRTGLSVRCLKD